MRYLTIIGCALPVAFATAVPAAAEAACTSPAEVRSRMLDDRPAAWIERRLTGDEALTFTDGFNAVPPVSGYRADEVLIFATLEAPHWRLVRFFRDGCLAGGGLLAAPLVDRILARLERRS